MSKDTFKLFVRNHPELAKEVINNNTTWQKLYEIYDIYGENSNVWDTYFSKATDALSRGTSIKDTTVSDVVDMVKKLDLDTVQKGVNNLQKTIGLLQDLGIGSSKLPTRTYEARPMYKYFED